MFSPGRGRSEVTRVETDHGKKIEDVLIDVIKNYNTWSDRSAVLRVSKVTLFTWTRRYLHMTPQEAVCKFHDGCRKKTPIKKQAGVRDYLSTTLSLLIPE